MYFLTKRMTKKERKKVEEKAVIRKNSLMIKPRLKMMDQKAKPIRLNNKSNKQKKAIKRKERIKNSNLINSSLKNKKIPKIRTKEAKRKLMKTNQISSK